MNLIESVATSLSKYRTFSGRATRSEYTWFIAFQFMVMSGSHIYLATVTGDPAPNPIMTGSLVLFFIVPTLAVTSRRLHDVGMSGWFSIVTVTPFGPLLFIWLAFKNTSGAGNIYDDQMKNFKIISDNKLFESTKDSDVLVGDEDYVGPNSISGQQDVKQRLSSLKQLLSDDLISVEEYNLKREEILKNL